MIWRTLIVVGKVEAVCSVGARLGREGLWIAIGGVSALKKDPFLLTILNSPRGKGSPGRVMCLVGAGGGFRRAPININCFGAWLSSVIVDSIDFSWPYIRTVDDRELSREGERESNESTFSKHLSIWYFRGILDSLTPSSPNPTATADFVLPYFVN
jgi:hypothetical protein